MCVSASRRWMKFKEQAHLALIGVHIGVGQCCRACNVESPTAALPTVSTRTIQAEQRRELPVLCKALTASFSNTLVLVSVASPP